MITRRDVIKTVASGLGAFALSDAAWAQAIAVRQQAAAAQATGLRFFTTAQHRTVDRLTDLIIPTDSHSPGASAARVADFIDYLLSAAEASEQQLWRDGLSELNRETARRWKRPFDDCTPAQQIEVLTELARAESSPRSTLERLFVRLKDRTIQGYYTSEIGIHQDLRYKGNTYLDEFVGCTHPEHIGNG